MFQCSLKQDSEVSWHSRRSYQSRSGRRAEERSKIRTRPPAPLREAPSWLFYPLPKRPKAPPRPRVRWRRGLAES